MARKFWNGSATKAAWVHYTQGDCWILAFEIERLYGHPVWWLREAGALDAMHYVVSIGAAGTPEQRFLDVAGLHTPQGLADIWDFDVLEPAPDHVRDMVAVDRAEGAEDYDRSWRRAPLMAKRLTKKHLR